MRIPLYPVFIVLVAVHIERVLNLLSNDGGGGRGVGKLRLFDMVSLPNMDTNNRHSRFHCQLHCICLAGALIEQKSSFSVDFVHANFILS